MALLPSRTTILLILFIIIIVTTASGGCSPASPSTLAPQSAYPSQDTQQCLPYGSAGPPAPSFPFDPPTDATPTPTAEAYSPVPTCTPEGPTPTPHPTSTPFISWPEYATSGIEVATAPQNLSISEDDEVMCDVSISPAAATVSWMRGAENRAYIAVRFPTGWSIFPSPIDAPCASATVSVAGRIHVLGSDGRYTYSDDDGNTWSPPVQVLPPGDHPHIVVGPDGWARAFILSDSTVYTARQQPNAWTTREAVASGIADYDVLPTEDGFLLAAAGNPSRIIRDGSTVFSLLPATSASLSHVAGRWVAGFSSGDRAVVAWSEDGAAWTRCLIQESTVDWDQPGAGQIGRTFGFADHKQEVIAFWTWWEPAGGSPFPYIAISRLPWNRCAPYPSPHDAQNLAQSLAGPPGLFFTHSPQREYRAAVTVDGSVGIVAYEGGQWNGNADIFAAMFAPDNVSSAPSP